MRLRQKGECLTYIIKRELDSIPSIVEVEVEKQLYDNSSITKAWVGITKEKCESAQVNIAKIINKPTKIRYDLVPPEAMHAIAETLTVNCENGKYPERDWEKGRSWAGEFAAVMRHMWKWWNPFVSSFDEDTGLSHLYHAITRLSFLIAYEERDRTTIIGKSVYNDKPSTD